MSRSAQTRTGYQETSMDKERGFTLIEIIVTLVLVGIMATVAGMGIVSMAQGYLFVRDNSVVAGKAQVALSRITRELTELHSIPNPGTNAGATSIGFNKVIDATSIGLGGQDDTEVWLATGDFGTIPDFANGDILMDQVSNLSFEYRRGGAAWAPGGDIRELSHIVVNLTMSGAGGGNDYVFTTVVNPRNNGNAGGEPIPDPEVDEPPGFVPPGSCFLATAVYNSPHHPGVIVLRQFRDRYLETWPGGRYLVGSYYKHGPGMAEAVGDNPPAKWLVKTLLAPVVFASFLLVHAKGAIPLVLMIFLAAAWTARRLLKRTNSSTT